jgi:DNA modification methylase
VKGQLGLEKTPQEYVEKLVKGFREVKRVLRDDGTLWLNLGDCYATGAGSGRSIGGDCFGKSNKVIDEGSFPVCQPNRMALPGLKSKDLVGVPWRVAFALQADGWYLRSDIIWHKPNPMPESVTDRPTKAHEYIFLLSKSAKYYYDAEAISETSSYVHRRSVSPSSRNGTGRNDCDREVGDFGKEGTRNKRSVWTVNTNCYSEAHFATFPPDLIKPCILAGCPLGGTVLDPFGGSGTTGQVALELGRSAILIELNPEYVKLIGHRTNVTPGLPL